MSQVDTDGIRSIITSAARSFTYWKYTDEASNIASVEDIMENNYMFVMLWNLFISHWIFPQGFFLFLAQNLKKLKMLLTLTP